MYGLSPEAEMLENPYPINNPLVRFVRVLSSILSTGNGQGDVNQSVSHFLHSSPCHLIEERKTEKVILTNNLPNDYFYQRWC